MTILYRGMDKAALDRAYNNTEAVPDYPAQRAAWQPRTDRAFAAPGVKRNLAYGKAPREVIDWLPCDKPDAPVFAFIHGGYWQRNTNDGFGFIAEGPQAHGFHVALIDYTLAPEATMDQIVAEIRRAIDWLGANVGDMGGDPARLYIGGHSAGGHLTATSMDLPQVAGGIAISGLFDLEPIQLGVLNDPIAMSPADAWRNSPIHYLPYSAAPLVVTVGGDELPELQRQSAEYAEAWIAKGLPGKTVAAPGHNHFTILNELAAPDGVLTRALVELANG